MFGTKLTEAQARIEALETRMTEAGFDPANAATGGSLAAHIEAQANEIAQAHIKEALQPLQARLSAMENALNATGVNSKAESISTEIAAAVTKKATAQVVASGHDPVEVPTAKKEPGELTAADREAEYRANHPPLPSHR